MKECCLLDCFQGLFDVPSCGTQDYLTRVPLAHSELSHLTSVVNPENVPCVKVVGVFSKLRIPLPKRPQPAAHAWPRLPLALPSIFSSSSCFSSCCSASSFYNSLCPISALQESESKPGHVHLPRAVLKNKKPCYIAPTGASI